MAQWIEHQTVNQNMSSLIPSQGTDLGCRASTLLGACKSQPISDVSLPFSLPSFLSKNKYINKYIYIYTHIYISHIYIYDEQLYGNKAANLDEIDKFLETYSLPKLNQEESDNLNRQIAPSETEEVSKNSKLTKVLDQMVAQVNFTNHSEN